MLRNRALTDRHLFDEFSDSPRAVTQRQQQRSTAWIGARVESHICVVQDASISHT
jgi:hypothetical protein